MCLGLLAANAHIDKASELQQSYAFPCVCSPPPFPRCVAQQEGEKLLRRVPEIDLVMGPQYANRLGDLLEDVMNGNQVM